MKNSFTSDEGVLSKASPQACATEITGFPPGTTHSELHALAWIRFAYWGAGVVLVVGFLYALSLGPVTRFYMAHPPIHKPGVMMSKGTLNGIEQSLTFPGWVCHVYSPAFRLLSSGERERGLGNLYRRYWAWCVDGKEECLRNLRRLDEAQRKWAADTLKMNGAIPFAAHIIDYLPKRSVPKCPTGGEYHFNPVGTKPECSVHGDDY